MSTVELLMTNYAVCNVAGFKLRASFATAQLANRKASDDSLQLQALLSFRADQVLVNGAQIVINRRDRLDVDLAFGHHPIQQQVEPIGIARLHKQAQPIVMQPRLDHVILIEHRAASFAGLSQRIRICIGCSSISSRTP